MRVHHCQNPGKRFCIYAHRHDDPAPVRQGYLDLTMFWDGKMLTLTSAYDICPQGRSGNEATQAMLLKGDNRMSTIATCLAAAPDYHLNETEAAALIEAQIATIAANWEAVCAEAELSPVDQKLFARRQFLNSYCLQGMDGHIGLQDAFSAARETLITVGDA